MTEYPDFSLMKENFLFLQERKNKMTDLTEQWKKGELINGKKYYITFFDSEPFEATFRAAETIFPFWTFEANGRQYCDENGYDCVKVLAPVPSYDEWKQLKEYERIVTSYNMKPIDYDIACETVNKLLDERKALKEENAQLKERNDSLNNRDINLCRIANGIRDENFALKELLKECKTPLEVYNEMFGNKEELLTKIDEVLRS